MWSVGSGFDGVGTTSNSAEFIAVSSPSCLTVPVASNPILKPQEEACLVLVRVSHGISILGRSLTDLRTLLLWREIAKMKPCNSSNWLVIYAIVWPRSDPVGNAKDKCHERVQMEMCPGSPSQVWALVANCHSRCGRCLFVSCLPQQLSFQPSGALQGLDYADF